ncbi:nucleotidyltransferase domain-containing protein, partial [Bacillus sp. JJ722]|uniref:nucleotidyltransferase domain-containing protein n=1 Tax=Bacillus sp. JJ722 TaxID=3122973 RepID=UPI002FFFC0FB
NHIRLLFMKGPAIAADLYGDISLRTSKDLDILVNKFDLKRVEELLLGVGYEKEEKKTILNEWKLGHHILYFHPQKKIQIEIHWRFQPPPSIEPKFNELWKNKRVSNITSYPVYFLGEEDLFLYLISHGARHGWCRLRWLLDINQMLKKELDYKKIIMLLRKNRISHLGGQALILASELFNTSIQKEMQILTENNRSKKLAHKAMFFISTINPTQIEFYNEYRNKYQTSIKPCHFTRLFNVFLKFYPKPIDAETLRLPKSLYFLYFFLHPFLSIFRKLTKEHK